MPASTRLPLYLRSLLRLVLVGALFGALLLGGFSYKLASQLIEPVPRPIGPPPANLAAETVHFDDIAGWFVPGQPGNACVLLLHGQRSDRRAMLSRARLLRQYGYSSLLIDLQGHGESPGERLTFGHREAAGAHAAVALLRARPDCGKVAVIGQSLGGAAALLGERPLEVDAMVLEAVYSDIELAARNRLQMRFGALGDWLLPLLTLQLQPRLGVSIEQLKPIERIDEVRSPLLLMAGSDDRHTTLSESQRLFAAANQPKRLWVVPGAAHVDLHRFAPQAYRAELIGFLEAHLGAPTRASASR